MKKLVLTVLMFTLIASPALAIDLKTITPKNLEVFMEILPKYTSLIKEYGDGASPMTSTSEAGILLAEKLQDLLKRYDIPMEEFAPFMQKITMGIAQAKMKQNGLPMNMFGMMGQESQLSATEISVITNNLPRLEKLFEEQ